jgi:hypothetical protein
MWCAGNWDTETLGLLLLVLLNLAKAQELSIWTTFSVVVQKIGSWTALPMKLEYMIAVTLKMLVFGAWNQRSLPQHLSVLKEQSA